MDGASRLGIPGKAGMSTRFNQSTNMAEIIEHVVLTVKLIYAEIFLSVH